MGTLIFFYIIKKISLENIESKGMIRVSQQIKQFILSLWKQS